MSKGPDRSASGEAVTRLILQIFPFHGLLGAAGDELTKPWALSSARWKVLGAIDSSSRPIHVAQIARNMGLTRQAVQRIVNDLADQGLLTLSTNPDHQRARLVALTRRGAEVLGEIMEEQIQWSNELAEGISPRALETAANVLETLRQRLEQRNREA
ncbi:MAG: MarR family transcriptional regulator [Acidobacteriota bacterium]